MTNSTICTLASGCVHQFPRPLSAGVAQGELSERPAVPAPARQWLFPVPDKTEETEEWRRRQAGKEAVPCVALNPEQRGGPRPTSFTGGRGQKGLTAKMLFKSGAEKMWALS